MEYEFTINCELPTLNEYTNANRINVGASKSKSSPSKFKRKPQINTGIVANNMKKKAEAKVILFAKTQIKPLPDTLFDVEILWIRTDNRHDADNVYFAVKFILDGLQKSGILKKDGRKTNKKYYIK